MAIRTSVTGGPDLTAQARGGPAESGGPLRAWAELLLAVTARAYRAFLLTLVAAALIPTLWHWDSYVVRSGSMEPELSVGDVVVTRPLSADDRVPNGRVMVFADPAREGRTLIHRVVENLGDGTFITAGDANLDTDSTPAPRKNFVARATICVPFVGLPLVWLDERDMGPLAFWVILTGAGLFFASRPPGGPMRPSRRGRGRSRRRLRTRGRADVRALTVAVGAGLVVATVLTLPVSDASTAFTRQTATRGSTWKVALSAAKATSFIQVFDTPSASGWYQRSAVAVNVYATASPGSSVRSVSYQVNSSAQVTVHASSTAFLVAVQGDNTVIYFATDGVGRAESAHTTHIKLDNQAPTLTVTSQTGDMSHAQWRATCASPSRPGLTGGVCGATADGPGSGVAAVTYVLFRSSDQRCFDGVKWTGAACNARTPGTVTGGTWLAPVPDGVLPTSRTYYTITVYVTDVAGNGYNLSRNFSVG